MKRLGVKFDYRGEEGEDRGEKRIQGKLGQKITRRNKLILLLSYCHL